MRSFKSWQRVSNGFKQRWQRLTVQQRNASYQRFEQRGGSQQQYQQQRQHQQPYSNFRPVARFQYIWRNYPRVVVGVGAGGTAVYAVNLEKVPLTGRVRFNVVSNERELSLVGDAGYQEILQEFRGKVLPSSHPYTQLVAKVTGRLLESCEFISGGDWTVHVIDEPSQVNAFVMPGGKVFVFTGLLPVAEDENGLAAVLGHEIAHNVAHHSAEKMSRQIITMIAGYLVSFVFDVSGQLGASLATLSLSLPNSRVQETEADHIGLLIMSSACYDPRQAPELWKRMSANEEKQGGAAPQFLSTHPASASRGEGMMKWMPEAMERYENNSCSITAKGFNDFKKIALAPSPLAGQLSGLLSGLSRS